MISAYGSLTSLTNIARLDSAPLHAQPARPDGSAPARFGLHKQEEDPYFPGADFDGELRYVIAE